MVTTCRGWGGGPQETACCPLRPLPTPPHTHTYLPTPAHTTHLSPPHTRAFPHRHTHTSVPLHLHTPPTFPLHLPSHLHTHTTHLSPHTHLPSHTCTHACLSPHTCTHDTCPPHLQDGEVLQHTVHHVLLGQVPQLVDEVDHVLAERGAVDSVGVVAVLVARALGLQGRGRAA